MTHRERPAEQRRQDDGERQPGQHEEPVGDAHESGLEPAAVVAGEEPMRAPIAIEMRVAASPTVSEIRDPNTVIVQIERPRLSVPNQNSALGGS